MRLGIGNIRASVGAPIWTPMALSPLAWYRADQYDGAGNWTDLSGNGNHATPQVIAHNPTLVTNVLNGKSVVRFAVNQGLLLPTSMGINTGGFTVWAVCKTTAIVGYATIISLGKNPQGGIALYARLAAGKWGIYASGDRPSTTFTDTQFRQLMVLASGPSTTATYRTDKTSEPVVIGTYDTTSAFIGTDTAVGSDNMSGDIREIIILNRVASAGEITSTEAYGSTEYGI